MNWHDLTDTKELKAMIVAAKNYVMSPAEREAQRKSWVVGEMMIEHPEMTRDKAEAIYNRVSGSGSV